MIKAMRECLKNWLIQHERLYWYIVIGLAVFGFGLATAMGCAKLEKAEAAEISVDDIVTSAEYQSIMQFRDEANFPYYSVVYLYNNDNGADYMMLFQNENGESLAHLTPMNVNGYYDNAIRLGAPVGGSGWCAFAKTDANSGVAQLTVWNYESCTWANHVSLYVVEGNMNIGLEVPYTASNPNGRGSATLYDVRNQRTTYSLDAPYVAFQNVNVVNRLMDKDYLASVFTNTYDVYTKGSSWTYTGILKNWDVSKNATYKLEVDFKVELPTEAYIEKQYGDAGVDLEWEHNVIKCAPDFIYAWYNDDKASIREYAFKYVFDIVPDSNGRFSYSLTFSEIETLLMYFDEGFRSRVQECSEYWRSIVMSYVHVDTVSSVVKTTYDDSIVYGKGTVNIFERGIYDSCVEVAPDVDYSTMTDEEIDAMIEEAVKNAYDEYYKGLEDKLNNLQGQIDDIYSVGDGFGGNLESTDLWTGFQNLAEGLSSLAPSIRALSVLTGAVFAFLPIQITGIISFTLFALCIIAIIKAIRG